MKGVCKQIVVKTEKKLIREALLKSNWNRKKAALMLEIIYRSLLNKIKQYRLTV
jgi:two-component system response regulator AtoC